MKVFFLQNTSCIRKPQVISLGVAHLLHPPLDLPLCNPVIIVNPVVKMRPHPAAHASPVAHHQEVPPPPPPWCVMGFQFWAFNLKMDLLNGIKNARFIFFYLYLIFGSF